MALDLLRVLQRAGPDVAAAVAAELEPLAGMGPVCDTARARVLDRLQGAVDEHDARRLAQDLALAVQAALLRRHAPDFVFEAFVAARPRGPVCCARSTPPTSRCRPTWAPWACPV